MNTVIQPSYSSFRNKIAMIEAAELASLGFAFWCLGAIPAISKGESFFDQIIFFFITQGMLLGSWAIYNLYIRIAHAGGKLVDIRLWVIATAVTGSYTFWAWSILDINRLIIAKFLYRGDAPVELAWSARSKQIRKVWEKARNEGYDLTFG